MQHRFYGLRGKDFLLERDRVFLEIKDDLAKDFYAIVDQTQKFTPKNLGELANKYLIPLTVLDVYLSELKLLRQGTLDELKDRCLRAKDVGVVWSEE